MSTVEEQKKDPKWKGLGHIAIDKKEAMSGFRWSLFFNLINKFLVPILNNVIVVRFLGPFIIGPFSILYAIFMASDVFRDFGLSLTYMRDQDMTPRKEASYMVLGILQGLIPAIILYALKDSLVNFFHSPEMGPMIIWVSLSLLVNGFWTIPKAKVLKLGRIKESGARETVANVIQLVLSIVMVLRGYALFGLVFPLFINNVLNVVITYGLAPITNFRADVKTILKTARSAASTLGASALYNIFIQADKFFIGRYAGINPHASLVDVGLYGQAQGLAQKPMQLLSVPMMTPLQSAFSQNSKDHAKLGNIYGRALAAAFIFIMPLYAIAVVTAGPATLVILGHKWTGSIPLVQICCVFFAARTIGTIGSGALVAGGRARLVMTSWLWGYIAAGIACYLAAKNHSVEGFAWAFSIGSVVVYSIHTIFAIRWFPPDQKAAHKIKVSMLVTLLSSLFFAGIYFLPFGPWVAFGLAVLLGPFVHMALVGWAFERKSLAFMSYKGAKRLYSSL